MKARKLSGRNLLNVRRKAKRGDAEAQFKLSEYYGFDKPRMYHKWLQLAAQQKHPAALYWLGREYEDGSIKSRDVARGEQLIRESAELGYARAQGIYGLMCIKRYGRTPPNYYEAVKWLRLSAAQGSRHAQYELGLLLENGHGFPTENPYEAVRQYSKSAKQGLADAQLALARCYCYGIGVRLDYATAMRWYRKASRARIKDCMLSPYIGAKCSIGAMYLYGWGVKADIVEAKKWFRKAKSDEASRRLGILSLMDVVRKYVPTHAMVKVEEYFKKAGYSSDFESLTGSGPDFICAVLNLYSASTHPSFISIYK